MGIMFPARTAKAAASVAIAATLLISSAAEGDDPLTPITELVIYGIDSDTAELMRYVFSNDTFFRIGVVRDQNGFVIDHPECLSYVPGGDNKGFYSSPMGKDGTGGPKNVLAKIDGLTAEAFMYSMPFTYKGMRGMTSVYDPIAGEWILLGIAHNNKDAKLVTFDLDTGEQSLVMDLDDAWGAPAFEGLSAHPDPDKLYVMTGWKLGELDRTTGVITDVADHTAHARIEALEIAFGDDGPAIEVPGVDPDWTEDGALFSFSNKTDDLLVYNPDGGLTTYPSTFSTVDCEGVVFMTTLKDPFIKVFAQFD